MPENKTTYSTDPANLKANSVFPMVFRASGWFRKQSRLPLCKGVSVRDFLICVDDTDNLESRGTGSIASEMAGIIESKGWGRCGFISRHQLVLHEAVRYTSS